MRKLTKQAFIQWNAVIMAIAANWNHSLFTPWPQDPEAPAFYPSVERYTEEILRVLNHMREDAGLPPFMTEAGRSLINQVKDEQ